MSKIAQPLALLAICYALLFTYVETSYHNLPEKVASHFNAEGDPNGWMKRDACIEFTIGLSIVMPGIVVALMASAGKIPVSFINLPHRDYWLDPQRRRAALNTLFQYSLWFASLNVLFVTGVHWLIVQANLPDHKPHLSTPGILIVGGCFLGGTALWLVLLVRHFSKIK